MKLFHRFPADPAQTEKAGAHRLLDRAMYGEKVSARDITEALRLTGDLVGERGQPATRTSPAIWSPEP